MTSKLTVGQVVYRPRRILHGPDKEWEFDELTIEKVGRKWAKSGYTRIAVDTLLTDGFNAGRVYLRIDDFISDQRVKDAWTHLRVFMDRHWIPPEGVTLAQISNAIHVLGADTDEWLEKLGATDPDHARIRREALIEAAKIAERAGTGTGR